MAIKKNAKVEAAEEAKKSYQIEVKRAKELENGTIMFDMEANGVMIYGCSYKILTRKDNGEEFAKIGFPSRKGSDGKYYNQAYLRVDADTLAVIEKGIEALI